MCNNATNDGQLLNNGRGCDTLPTDGAVQMSRAELSRLRDQVIALERVLTAVVGGRERLTEQQWRERIRAG